MKVILFILLIMVTICSSLANDATDRYVSINYSKAVKAYNQANNSYSSIVGKFNRRCVDMPEKMSSDLAKSRIKDFGYVYKRLGQLRYTMKQSSKKLLNLYNLYKIGQSWSAHVAIDRTVGRITKMRENIVSCMRNHAIAAMKKANEEYSDYLSSNFKYKYDSICIYDLRKSSIEDARTVLQTKIEDVKILETEYELQRVPFDEVAKLWKLMDDKIDYPYALTQFSVINKGIDSRFGHEDQSPKSYILECIDLAQSQLESLEE